MRDGGGGEDAVLSDDEVLDTVTSSNLDDLLDALGRVEATVSSNDERGSLSAGGGDSREDGLDEVLGVVLLLEDGDPAGKKSERQDAR